ncbi:MAG: GNAT family N-acetyltransferase, partial [Planctomycetes bacterium]|nr:GNAT family N-acetyltransferase [Planctomycetota bacterium]
VSDDWLEALRSSARPDPWTHGFAIVLRETREVIGTFGFKGPPTASGTAEIAYAIVPARENQGFATEAVALGSRFALGQGVAKLVAHTMPERNASGRVLEKSGFHKVGVVEDPDIGPAWSWERAKAE